MCVRDKTYSEVQFSQLLISFFQTRSPFRMFMETTRLWKLRQLPIQKRIMESLFGMTLFKLHMKHESQRLGNKDRDRQIR